MNNIDEILAMAQNVQNELQKAQDSLDTIEVKGASGGGAGHGDGIGEGPDHRDRDRRFADPG